MAKAEKTKPVEKKGKAKGKVSFAGKFVKITKLPKSVPLASPDWNNLLELRERRLAISYRKK